MGDAPLIFEQRNSQLTSFFYALLLYSLLNLAIHFTIRTRDYLYFFSRWSTACSTIFSSRSSTTLSNAFLASLSAVSASLPPNSFSTCCRNPDSPKPPRQRVCRSKYVPRNSPSCAAVRILSRGRCKYFSSATSSSIAAWLLLLSIRTWEKHLSSIAALSRASSFADA